MPAQTFEITRAPEAHPVDYREIYRMISVERKDSEWYVRETTFEKKKHFCRQFSVIYYDGSIMVRRCKECENTEFRCESWTNPKEVHKVVTDLFGCQGFGSGIIDVDIGNANTRKERVT